MTTTSPTPTSPPLSRMARRIAIGVAIVATFGTLSAFNALDKSQTNGQVDRILGADHIPYVAGPDGRQIVDLGSEKFTLTCAAGEVDSRHDELAARDGDLQQICTRVWAQHTASQNG